MSASKHRVYHRLQLASHRLQKAADRAILAAAGITTAQAAVLSIVGAESAVSQRSVARKLGLNESAMTAMTSRLLGLGLLDRLPDETDSRAWSLKLTAEGRAAMKRIEQPFRLINQKIEKALDADEIAKLADYLTRISDAFGEPRATPSGSHEIVIPLPVNQLAPGINPQARRSRPWKPNQGSTENPHERSRPSR